MQDNVQKTPSGSKPSQIVSSPKHNPHPTSGSSQKLSVVRSKKLAKFGGIPKPSRPRASSLLHVIPGETQGRLGVTSLNTDTQSPQRRRKFVAPDISDFDFDDKVVQSSKLKIPKLATAKFPTK